MTTLRRAGSTMLAILLGGTALAAGCATAERPRQLGPQAFADRGNAPERVRIPTEPNSPVDQPGPLLGADQVNRVSVDLMRTDEERRRAGGESVAAVSPTVEQAVRPRNGNGGGAPARDAAPSTTVGDATRTTPRRAAGAGAPGAGAAGAGAGGAGGPGGGGFITVGAVVAEVNGTPIYANQVVEDIEPRLAAEAKNLDEERFRTFATAEVAQRITGMITNELEYAAALRHLDAKEKELVEYRTAAWRQEQITRAGGSIEAARRRFAADGRDFEEAVRDRYRLLMSIVYYQKKVWPQVQVTADDLRRYYERNADREFTVFDTATFRWIKIETRKLGGDRQKALDKAQLLRTRAAGGEDFATLAKESTDPRIAETGGALPPIQRGAFAVEKVEHAVWKLQPGDVSDVIDGGDGTYYVVKLESREQGHTRPFEDPAVQAEIEDTLKKQQFASLREKAQEELLKDAIVRGHPRERHYDPSLMRPAVEIAMQQYAAWRGE